jgi:hypothetical protein
MAAEGVVAQQRRMSSHSLSRTLMHETRIVGHAGGSFSGEGDRVGARWLRVSTRKECCEAAVMAQEIPRSLLRRFAREQRARAVQAAKFVLRTRSAVSRSWAAISS